MAPTRIQLHGLTQSADEPFKQYAHILRELAAIVQPPLLERELVDMFLDTLQGPYLTARCASEFSKMIVVTLKFSLPLSSKHFLRLSSTQGYSRVDQSNHLLSNGSITRVLCL